MLNADGLVIWVSVAMIVKFDPLIDNSKPVGGLWGSKDDIADKDTRTNKRRRGHGEGHILANRCLWVTPGRGRKLCAAG
jgi:hypothetical protein